MPKSSIEDRSLKIAKQNTPTINHLESIPQPEMNLLSFLPWQRWPMPIPSIVLEQREHFAAETTNLFDRRCVEPDLPPASPIITLCKPLQSGGSVPRMKPMRHRTAPTFRYRPLRRLVPLNFLQEQTGVCIRYYISKRLTTSTWKCRAPKQQNKPAIS